MGDLETFASKDPALLQYHIDDLRRELDRLRGERVPIRFELQGDNARLPARAHGGDAGFDLYCSSQVRIHPGSFVDVPTGVHCELPASMWAMIVGRSSTLRKRGLLVNHGIIDSGYRGELFAGVWNLTPSTVVVEVGERLAQLIPVPLSAAQLVARQVDQVGWGDRGHNGFGSTGT